MKQQSDDLVGQTLGTCTLEKVIGQGGMGTVYLARQARPARHVAIKVLQPNLAPDSQVYQEFLARFRREADVIARLEHVNIMPIYEYGEQDGLAYLVMPYLAGGSLRDKLSKQGALPLPEVVRYMQQAASALDYAHSQGVVHRDLKPGNFLLHNDGRLILADFGIARIMAEATTGATLTSAGTLLGTPEYMAPEMVRGESIDYRADIYELGIVLFQLLSGRLPFSGTTPYAVVYQQAQEPLPLLHTTQPQIPSEVDAVIQKATAKQREGRYPSVQAMADALSAASSGPPSEPPYDPQASIPTVFSPATNFPTQRPDLASAAAIPPTLRSSPSHAPAYPSTPPASSVQYTPPPPPGQGYPSPTTHAPASGRRLGLLIIGVLLAAILIVGGVLVGLQLSRGSTIIGPSPTATTAPASPTANNQPTPTATPAATASPTAPASPTTAAPTPTAPTQTNVPVGTQLYAASAPGHNCDNNGGEWVDYNSIKITCQGSQTRLQNTATSPILQGSFLTKLPGKAYPTDYVVEVQIQQDQQSASDFGIYFRNQPGKQQGVYTFIVHPDGTWNAYVYDNNTGAATRLTGGTIGDAHAALALAVVVQGSQFRFYANGKELGTVSDQTYSSGTAGIVVDQGGTITASHFALYNPA